MTVRTRQGELERDRPLPAPPWPRSLRPDEVGVALGVILLPLINPPGPGNSGVADFGLVVAVVTWLLCTRAGGASVRVPYLFAVTVLASGGAVAIVAGGPGRGVLALGQEGLLLLWSAALAAMVAHDRGLVLVLRVWVVTVLASAAGIVLGVALGLSALSGVTPGDGSRAAGTLGDPNLAASYLLVGLLVLRAAQWPRRAPLRWACAATIVTALVMTASNGGLLALAVATSVGAIAAVGHRHGAAAAVALACGGLLLVGAVLPRLPWSTLQRDAAASAPVLHDSLGRSGQSSASRGLLFAETVRLAREEGLLGLGPGGTKAALRARQAPYVKESHDDYLAALVERGLIGVVGLVLLAQTLVLRMRLVLLPARRASLAEVLPRPELLGCALLTVALSAMFYEVLHFRHVWALFGLVAGLSVRQFVLARS